MNGWRWNEKRCGSHWVRGEPVYFPSHYRRFSSSRSFARAFRSFATRFSPLVLPRNAPITSAGRVTTWMPWPVRSISRLCRLLFHIVAVTRVGNDGLAAADDCAFREGPVTSLQEKQ